MRWMALACAATILGCANAPSINYAPGPDDSMEANGGFQYQNNGTDTSEARGLEQAEADCATQGKHAVSKRVEGETIYECR
jgi:hypothetical protein